VGDAAMHSGAGVAMHYGGANQESEPDQFGDGAYYATNAAATAERRARKVTRVAASVQGQPPTLVDRPVLFFVG
jgi:hypothetical protein